MSKVQIHIELDVDQGAEILPLILEKLGAKTPNSANKTCESKDHPALVEQASETPVKPNSELKEPSPTLTVEMVRAQLNAIKEKHPYVDLVASVKKFNAFKLTEVKPESYESLIADARGQIK